MARQSEKMQGISEQLARWDERWKILSEMPGQIKSLESKIDGMTGKFATDYVSKDELDRILEERKSGFLSVQNITIGLVNIVLAALVSMAIGQI